MLEKEIQSTIMAYLSWQKNIYYFRSASGGFKTAEYKGKSSFFRTGKVGCPDIIVCKEGRFIGLEVKTEKGKQSPAQKLAEQDIIQAGGEYHLVRNMEDVVKIIEKNGNFRK